MSAPRPEPVAAVPPGSGNQSWMVPDAETQGIKRYLEALRAGRWIVLGAVVACVAVAAVYLAQTAKVYEASADVLITPQSAVGVPVSGIITQSNDPTRDIETVARLIESPTVAQRVKRDLGLKDGTQGLLGKVTATPLAQSNIVTVAARDDSPRASARLADAFAEQFVALRTARLRASLQPQITQLRQQVQSGGGGAAGSNTADSPQQQLQTLETLSRTGDPSVSLESRAEIPTGAVAPRPLFTLGSALVAGLVLGILGAFALQLLDPRLRSEEDLRSRFRLPILARVPLERRRKNRPLLPSELSLGALDSYQALRAGLDGSRGEGVSGRMVLVTGPTPGDGKTTAAINLASTIAAAGKRVILIEADSRRPSVGRALDMTTDIGLASVITGRNYLVDALKPVGEDDARLRVLLTNPDEVPAADVLSHLSVDTLLLQAQRLADWIIIDSPPLNHVAETMAIARAVDDVLVVVRMGRTNSRDLTELGEMLQQQDIVPEGFVVLGGHARQAYY